MSHFSISPGFRSLDQARPCWPRAGVIRKPAARAGDAPHVRPGRTPREVLESLYPQ
jgi:hypothetical protein